jgi:ornithine--oxo-acid transaminase
MTENAASQGELFRSLLAQLASPLIKTIRGKGLLNAIVIDHPHPEAAWEICLQMMQHGLLAKPTHGDKIRFAPPLLITETQIREAIEIIAQSLEEVAARLK